MVEVEPLASGVGGEEGDAPGVEAGLRAMSLASFEAAMENRDAPAGCANEPLQPGERVAILREHDDRLGDAREPAEESCGFALGSSCMPGGFRDCREPAPLLSDVRQAGGCKL